MKSDLEKLLDEIVHFARVAIQGDPRQTGAFVRRLARKIDTIAPERAGDLKSLLASAPRNAQPAVARKAPPPSVPVDGETRLSLLQQFLPGDFPYEPILPTALRDFLIRILTERQKASELEKVGLKPTKSALFVGPPGVGKTLTAHWLATQLGEPLYTLNLASVMSSYLGRTGANLRNVLAFFQHNDGILFLDEFDAVAKKRSDESDIGELRRLVTVILQEIDNWPSNRLLIAATNHAELLDPAVWRRFDAIVNFELPTDEQLYIKAKQMLRQEKEDELAHIFALVMSGSSFSDLENEVRKVQRHAVISGEDTDTIALSHLKERIGSRSKDQLKTLATFLIRIGMSQRQISDFTGLARDTIRAINPKD